MRRSVMGSSALSSFSAAAAMSSPESTYLARVVARVRTCVMLFVYVKQVGQPRERQPVKRQADEAGTPSRALVLTRALPGGGAELVHFHASFRGRTEGAARARSGEEAAARGATQRGSFHRRKFGIRLGTPT
jgi:hypothetical protein